MKKTIIIVFALMAVTAALYLWSWPETQVVVPHAKAAQHREVQPQQDAQGHPEIERYDITEIESWKDEDGKPFGAIRAYTLPHACLYLGWLHSQVSVTSQPRADGEACHS